VSTRARTAEIVWTQAGPLPADHAFFAELEAARARGSIADLLARISRHFAVSEIHPRIIAYIEASLHAERARGPFEIAGIADALLVTTTCQRVFGRFDGPFPLLFGSHALRLAHAVPGVRRTPPPLARVPSERLCGNAQELSPLQKPQELASPARTQRRL
jgi:hypothetical protein